MNQFLVTAAGLLLFACPLTHAADFKPDDNGYIRNWLLLQPFEIGDKASEHEEGSQKDFFTKEYFTGQFKATPKVDDSVKANGSEVTWKAGQADEPAYKLEAKDNSLYLAVTYVISETEVPGAVLSIGSDDSSCWRVNGSEVLTVYSGRAVEPDQDKSRSFTLTKGTNVISAAVINGGGEVGLSARILDKDGTPVKNVVISLTPPAK